jgi:hypothetical protein
VSLDAPGRLWTNRRDARPRFARPDQSDLSTSWSANYERCATPMLMKWSSPPSPRGRVARSAFAPHGCPAPRAASLSRRVRGAPAVAGRSRLALAPRRLAVARGLVAPPVRKESAHTRLVGSPPVPRSGRSPRPPWLVSLRGSPARAPALARLAPGPALRAVRFPRLWLPARPARPVAGAGLRARTDAYRRPTAPGPIDDRRPIPAYCGREVLSGSAGWRALR